VRILAAPCLTSNKQAHTNTASQSLSLLFPFPNDLHTQSRGGSKNPSGLTPVRHKWHIFVNTDSRHKVEHQLYSRWSILNEILSNGRFIFLAPISPQRPGSSVIRRPTQTSTLPFQVRLWGSLIGLSEVLVRYIVRCADLASASRMDEEVALLFGSATHWRNGIAGLSNKRQEEVAALADMSDL
jgi:hypothetical protein